ncbi:peptidoglycan DD-metalloendopeptidase family protein [Streptomyces sp. NPDC055078]
MRLRHRDRPLLATVALCVLLSAAPAAPSVALASERLPPPPPGAVADPVAGPSHSPSHSPSHGPSHGPDMSTDAAVMRLYEEVAAATAAYERGRRAAEARRVTAGRLQGLLDRRRRELAAMHDAMGAVARAQYRTGGRLAFTARLLLARDPDELLRGRRYARQAEAAVSRLIGSVHRAEQRLSSAQRRARAAWHDLDTRNARLAAVKRRIETRLESAQWTLQGEADRRVAAGKCAGAVRLDRRDGVPPMSAWVTPVEMFELSAGFASAGERWARRHTGQDFAVGIGAPVRSVGAGRVRSVSCGGAFGIEIVVAHPGGYYTQYAHLASISVDQGEKVRAGQVIGLAGTTGNSTGPHLHFEVRLTPYLGSGVDPAEWLRERGVRLEPTAAPGPGPGPGPGPDPDPDRASAPASPGRGGG